MRLRLRIPHVLVLAAAMALAAVGAALVAQYGFDMQPCVWCVLQRLIFLVIGVSALAGALLSGTARRLAVAAAGAAALCGVAASLWQQFYAARQASCDLTLADRIISGLHLDQAVPQVFVAYASCADAAVDLLGIPFAFWSCAMFALLAALSAWTLRATARAAGSPLAA